MFKTTLIINAVAAFAIMATDSKAADASSTNASSSRSVSPTSRDTNTSSRIYSSTNSNGSTKDADNTGRNVRDRSDATLTPGDQSNSKSDLEITRRIRRALTSDDQLSTTAKNIKIITDNGKVTLRGPVKTAGEQQAILSVVKNVAGQSSVNNELEVKAVNQ
jgi:hyperosmotically inducible protein